MPSSPSTTDEDANLDRVEATNEDPAPSKKPWLQLASLGMELAGATLGMAAVGGMIDWYRDQPLGIGVAFGALVGFGFGMLRFIQKAMQQINRS